MKKILVAVALMVSPASAGPWDVQIQDDPFDGKRTFVSLTGKAGTVLWFRSLERSNVTPGDFDILWINGSHYICNHDLRLNMKLDDEPPVKKGFVSVVTSTDREALFIVKGFLLHGQIQAWSQVWRNTIRQHSRLLIRSTDGCGDVRTDEFDLTDAPKELFEVLGRE